MLKEYTEKWLEARGVCDNSSMKKTELDALFELIAAYEKVVDMPYAAAIVKTLFSQVVDDFEKGNSPDNVSEIRVNMCQVCYKNFKKHIDNDGKWDGHSYKPTCKHFPENIVVSIG